MQNVDWKKVLEDSKKRVLKRNAWGDEFLCLPESEPTPRFKSRAEKVKWWSRQPHMPRIIEEDVRILEWQRKRIAEHEKKKFQNYKPL